MSSDLLIDGFAVFPAWATPEPVLRKGVGRSIGMLAGALTYGLTGERIDPCRESLLKCVHPFSIPHPKHLIKDVNNLPFLKPKGWPRLRKMSGESRYGFSEDDDLIEDALNELMSAYEAKDHSKLIQALKALIELIRNKEPDASDPLQDA
jgi:hypothetical protein